MVKCGGYIIGEFGHLMVHKHESSPSAQWQLLKDKFYTCNEWETKQVSFSFSLPPPPFSQWQLFKDKVYTCNGWETKQVLI
jgi:hypothetical protein